jgi:membrane carboxypeptidase/penicillin-binding protein
MALGAGEATPLQIAAAYTMFANKGRRLNPIAIKRVSLATGTTIYRSGTVGTRDHHAAGSLCHDFPS